MDIEEKSRRDLIERYKRVERKEQILKHGLTKGLKNFLKQQCFDVVDLNDVKLESKPKESRELQPYKPTSLSVAINDNASIADSQSRWKIPKPQPIEEDEYFEKIEEIVKRDFYPDLLKLEAYREYENCGKFKNQRIPSILLKSTDKSRINH